MGGKHSAEYYRAWRAANIERLREYSREYSKRNSAKAVQRVRDWRKNNRERRNETERRRYQEIIERKREFHSQWRERNRDRTRNYSRKWYAKPENKRKDSLKSKRWRGANPEKCRTHWIATKAKRRRAEGKHTSKDIARIRKDQRDKCAMPSCRIELHGKGHVDHIVPLARGGSNWPRNLQLLCPTCNHAKNARDPIDHARSLGFLL